MVIYLNSFSFLLISGVEMPCCLNKTFDCRIHIKWTPKRAKINQWKQSAVLICGNLCTAVFSHSEALTASTRNAILTNFPMYI